jgi:alpha-galactosidase
MKYSFFLAAILISQTICLDNGVALTPGMGWNSWNHFHCDGLNEKVVMDTID